MKLSNYFMPKSYVYTGKHTEVQTQIRHYQYNEKIYNITDSFKPLENVKHYIQVVGLANVQKIQSLREFYTIDPLVLEDVFNVHQRDKIETQDKHVFAVFHIHYLDGEIIQEDYMSLLLFEDTLITFHEKEPLYLKALTQVIENVDEVRKNSIDYLFYQVLDIITDHNLDVYDYLEGQSEEFEDRILESKPTNQEEFYLIRKNLLKIKNSVSPILEQLQELVKKENYLISKHLMGYFEDLMDHLRRLDIRLSESRELMRHLLDLHMNNQSNKMNKIMTTLTLFSAIFIPLSFLTGFFGMNFVHFEILTRENALVFFIGFCVLLAVTMVWIFKRIKWL